MLVSPGREPHREKKVHEGRDEQPHVQALLIVVAVPALVASFQLAVGKRQAEPASVRRHLGTEPLSARAHWRTELRAASAVLAQTLGAKR